MLKYDIQEVRKYLEINRDFFQRLLRENIKDPQLSVFMNGLRPLLYQNTRRLSKDSITPVIYKWRDEGDFEPALGYEEIRKYIVDNKELLEPFTIEPSNVDISDKQTMTQDHQKLTCDLIHEVNHPTSEVISDPMMNIGMQVLGGFIALVGCAAVTTAFVLLNAATFGIPGLIVAGLGVAFVLGGVGLFARGTSQKNQTEPDVTIDFSEEQLPAPL